MKILSVGSDNNLFKEGSAVALRQIDYGKQVEKLYIVNFCLLSSYYQNIKLSENVYVYPTRSLFKLLYSSDAFLIARKLQKPDLVVAQDPFEAGLGAFFIASYFDVPFQIQIHTDLFSPYFAQTSYLNKLRLYIAKFLLKRAGGIRVVSERIKKSLLATGLEINEDNIDVLPIWVDTAKIKSAPIAHDLHKKYSQFERIILMASRLTREKNIILAIEAMAVLVKKYARLGLIIVGDGPEKNNIEHSIESFNLENNVIIEEWNNDLSSYYKTADIFLLTSNFEGYGMTVIEALSAGTPVVMSDVGCAGEIVEDGTNGLIFEVGNLDKLRMTLERLIGDPILYEQLRTNIEKLLHVESKEAYLKRYVKSWDKSIFRGPCGVFSNRRLFWEDTDDHLVQLLRYVVVGTIAFASDFFALIIFKEYFGINYLLASVFSFMVGLMTNYILNIKWVFKKGSNFGKYAEILLFLLINFLGLVGSTFLIWLLTGILGVYYLISKIFATVVVLVWNFLVRKYILYK